jgi:hypothetical protein
MDGLAHRLERLPARLHIARQLARHVLVLPESIVALEGRAQAEERRLGARLGRRVGEIEPDLAVRQAHRIAAQVVAADQGLPEFEVELPIVPVAGQQAVAAPGAFTERALAQGIALVRAAVVAGVDLRAGGEEGDLLLALLDHHDPARAQLVQLGDGDEAGRARVGVYLQSLGFRRRHGAILLLSKASVFESIADETFFFKVFSLENNNDRQA